MTLLSSLPSDANVAVIGASGGIGGAFVDALSADDGVKNVYAFSRSAVEIKAGNMHSHHIDLCDEPSIEAAADTASAEGPLDLVIVATGVLHRGEELRPEKSLRDINASALAEVFEVNAIGPALVGKHFLPTLRRHSRTVFAVLSARVGSIGDNRLGGWLSYRMSKSAVNMLVRTVAIEQARSRPESVVVALHPGTVATGLSRPFTGRVDEAKLFATEYSAGKLLQVINSLEREDSGGFFAYDGTAIPY